MTDQSWKHILQSEFDKAYYNSLREFVDAEYLKNICYPPHNEIFAAFESCSFKDVKVIIIGQDPYHGPGQAHGLSFSVRDGIRFPPSLRNIFKEIAQDLDKPIPQSGDLTRWARQGVLLLNATLTVRQGEPGSHHGKGWEIFTDSVIEKLSDSTENLVFMLWGAYAQKKCSKVDRTKHLVLESCHPSPLSANRGDWFGSAQFSKANAYLNLHGKSEIDW